MFILPNFWKIDNKGPVITDKTERNYWIFSLTIQAKAFL